MSRFGPDSCLFPLLLALSNEPTSFDKFANGTFESSGRPSKPNILLTDHFGKSNFEITVVKIKTECKIKSILGSFWRPK